eukprot:TRINITY_DN2253_c0_g1_i5.p1 TRINITY_DN2253_c0_g1~~TRINITY_DN2253_c0_g1_i5.p1  ORF type:complete len:111 (+),score=30.81 TRINITY_DN2253_c0_g1_i5:88-420(+)
MIKKYYDKLFKEFCLADLSRFREGKVGLRWRTKAEVLSGKGQLICGNKICSSEDSLESLEVNFAYKEDGERKNALVKVVLCPLCKPKLRYQQDQEKKNLSSNRNVESKKL